jgi:hypothetical protein
MEYCRFIELREKFMEVSVKFLKKFTNGLNLYSFSICFFSLCSIGCGSILLHANDNDFAGVTVTGIHHIGPDFNIADFYVDGYSGSNVGREGGGGRYVCCVMLPSKWRPGLSVEVRWSVANWSKEILAETNVGNYRSLTFQRYKARVPVEKYISAENMYVHFFPGGKIRVVSSSSGPRGTRHPILEDDPRAAEIATTGTPVDAMFTESELDKIRAARYNDSR